MLNREKYRNEIIDAVVNDIGLKDGKPVSCFQIRCADCGFYDYDFGCNGKAKEWLNSEYVEPAVDWSKVAVDTPILVGNYENYLHNRRYFAKYENGHIYAYREGKTSFSAESKNDITSWKYGKLAESEGADA